MKIVIVGASGTIGKGIVQLLAPNHKLVKVWMSGTLPDSYLRSLSHARMAPSLRSASNAFVLNQLHAQSTSN